MLESITLGSGAVSFPFDNPKYYCVIDESISSFDGTYDYYYASKNDSKVGDTTLTLESTSLTIASSIRLTETHFSCVKGR